MATGQAARRSGPRSAPVVVPEPLRNSTARSSTGSWPAGVSDGTVTGMSGVRPILWIQRWSGVSHFATVSLTPPELLSSSIQVWTVPLPYEVSPISVARFVSWSAPATISLADALPLSMRTATLILRSVAMPFRHGVCRVDVALGVLLPEDRAALDERAGHGPRRGHETAGVAPQVDDELRLALVERRLDGLDEIRRAPLSEKPVSAM